VRSHHCQPLVEAPTEEVSTVITLIGLGTWRHPPLKRSHSDAQVSRVRRGLTWNSPRATSRLPCRASITAQVCHKKRDDQFQVLTRTTICGSIVRSSEIAEVSKTPRPRQDADEIIRSHLW
jgi:hypothetical protein